MERHGDGGDHRLMLSHDFVVIDPLHVDRDAWQDLPSRPLLPPQHHGQAHLFPMLVSLGELSFEGRIALWERALTWQRKRETHFFSAVLASGEKVEHLCRHLIASMQLPYPGSGTQLFRLHDPRVFRHLQWILSQEQIQHLLGPVTRWTWCEPSGHLVSVVNDVPLTRAGRMRLRLQDDQWGSLYRLAEINLCLASLIRVAPDLLDDASAARQLDKLLAEAWQMHGLSERDDRLLYAEQAFRFQKGVHQHPVLAQRLEKARQGTMSYIGACADLDDDIMRALVRELPTLKERVPTS